MIGYRWMHHRQELPVQSHLPWCSSRCSARQVSGVLFAVLQGIAPTPSTQFSSGTSYNTPEQVFCLTALCLVVHLITHTGQRCTRRLQLDLHLGNFLPGFCFALQPLLLLSATRTFSVTPSPPPEPHTWSAAPPAPQHAPAAPAARRSRLPLSSTEEQRQ